MVGNVMIDTLLAHREAALALDVPGQLGLEPRRYGVLTLHRPSNVDDLSSLERLFGAIGAIAADLPLAFPVHPRTRPALSRSAAVHRLVEDGRVRLLDPLGYLEFLGLMAASRVVITNPGGIQEETTVLGVPCLTLRNSTERPVTVTEGTNRLVGTEPASILTGWHEVRGGSRPARVPRHWDGRAARRIVEIVLRHAAVPEGTPVRAI